MNTRIQIEIAPKEAALIAEIIQDGHDITDILKSENEFRVRFNYLGGRATGSRAIVYNICGAMQETAEDIRVTHAWLAENAIQKSVRKLYENTND